MQLGADDATAESAADDASVAAADELTNGGAFRASNVGADDDADAAAHGASDAAAQPFADLAPLHHRYLARDHRASRSKPLAAQIRRERGEGSACRSCCVDRHDHRLIASRQFQLVVHSLRSDLDAD